MNVAVVVIVFFLLVVLLLLIHLTYRVEALRTMAQDADDPDDQIDQDDTTRARLARTKNYVYAGLVLTIVLLVAIVYILLLGTPWSGHVHEWLNLIVRWMHITFGIAWIGTSFYFVFLENALNRTRNVRPELAGNLWAVHGGGFYYLEKYKLAPATIPRDLHWFKYEAYFTWLSGFCLLAIVYYLDAHSFLIDPAVLPLTSGQAIGISVGSLMTGWIVYDRLCRSRLARNATVFAITGFVLAVGLAMLYTALFNSRAAYLHFGALLGTLMAANVFFVIIPSQKAMVRAAKRGEDLDPDLGKHAGLRSLHNNYLTLPVLFVMISNH
ncbi:MAG: urate hydroxylase PuuD, partial [Saprospiraceae bacterium]|nr:urate hydroxylase PuuD [Saprospiraceae bacterium]